MDSGSAIRSVALDEAPDALRDAALACGTRGQIWYSGPLDLALHEPRVAVIGSRDAGDRSLAAIMCLAAELAQRGAVIVSGGARGTDMCAHLSAIDADGETIACLPFGVGIAAGRSGRPELARHAGPRLLLVSPFRRDMPPTRSSPVIRNRMIAELAQAVVAGEAGVRSGTLHCVREALALRRPVFYLATRRGSDAALKALHATLRAEGANPFTLADAASGLLATRIVAAAREFSASHARARKMQTSLFDES